MYKEFETETSYQYLKRVVCALEEPICILGGWAVFFHVNKNFQQAQGRPYLGSRDIDVGFHLNSKATPDELKKSALARSINILQETLQFTPQGFRFFKDLHTETGEEAKEGEYIPAHVRFPLYVDVIVDNIPPAFKETFQFTPIDEPLLQHAFRQETNRTTLKEFNKKLLLPTPALLLGTKTHSLAGRDKQHKRIKDLCDIFALLWYTKGTPQDTANEARTFINHTKFKQTLRKLQKEDYQHAADQLNHSPEEIRRVMEILTTPL